MNTTDMAAIGGLLPVGRAVTRSSPIHAPSPRAAWHSRLAQRIENPAGNRLARFGQRDHDPERRLAPREIVGAVKRVDHPAQRIAEPVEQGRIGMGGFLANDRGLGQQLRQSSSRIASASLSAMVTTSSAALASISLASSA